MVPGVLEKSITASIGSFFLGHLALNFKIWGKLDIVSNIHTECPNKNVAVVLITAASFCQIIFGIPCISSTKYSKIQENIFFFAWLITRF